MARGEATGHAHRILMAPPIKLFLIDVLFKMIDEVIKDGIVARGEATGHAHRILMAPPIKLFLIKATMYLVALDACIVEHEEHKEIKLQGQLLEAAIKGAEEEYKARADEISKEYDHFLEETREVAD